ncbi:GNAT family N-acetyltransferase [Metaplanococcus flavidus]|uniref:GNAT family N-acetyltransferase n=1 Tax=Metaplanococcus flavidus TaxID=569883 RepID=A0ABW3LG91_9BACL
MNIRKAALSDARGIAEVHVDSWITTYRNIIPDEYLNQLTYEAREQLWINNLKSCDVFVAEDENGKIVGFADNGEERTGNYEKLKGEVYSIYILEEHQGKGLGNLLLKKAVRDLLDKGIHSMLIWVLAENRACGFYEKMGGRIADTKSVKISDKQLREVAYAWEDIHQLS